MYLSVVSVRRPTSLLFSEFVYKKHCLWRQQGVRPDVAYLARELPAGAVRIASHVCR